MLELLARIQILTPIASAFGRPGPEISLLQRRVLLLLVLLPITLRISRTHSLLQQLQASLRLLVVLGGVVRGQQLVPRDFTVAEAARVARWLLLLAELCGLVLYRIHLVLIS